MDQPGAVSQTTPLPAAGRAIVAGMCRGAAQAALMGAILTLPWRWRWLLASRPQPPIYADLTDWLLYAPDLCLGVLLLAALGECLAGGERWTRPPALLTALWGLLLAMAVASTAGAIDRGLALLVSGQWVLAGGLLWFLSQPAFRPGWVFGALAAQLGVQATVAVGQMWQQGSVGLSRLGERTLSLPDSSFVWAEGGRQLLRAYGLSDHPNILAMNGVLALVLVAGWVLWHREDWALPLLAVSGLGGVALVYSFSRFAWYAGILAVLAAFLLLWRAGLPAAVRRWFFLVLTVLLFTLPFALPLSPYLGLGESEAVIDARLAERLRQQSVRQQLNESAVLLFAQAPLAGKGAGNFALAQQAAFPDAPYDYQPAPVTLLTVTAELGLAGGLAYTLLLALPWLDLLFHRQRRRHPLLLLTLVALLAYTVISLFDAYPWAYSAGRYWLALLLGLWLHTRRLALPATG